MKRPSARPGPIMLALMLLCLALLPACSNWRMPGQPKIIDVKAEYLGLKDRSVAVLVWVRDYTEFNHPQARPAITRQITQRILTGVPGTTLADPDKVLKWQEANPYWATLPPSKWAESLKVERVVVVEIDEYRTHEPGDRYVLRGVISASVKVVEAEAADPDNFAAEYSKLVMYPTSEKLGSSTASEDQIEQITLVWFSEEAAGLFFDHQLKR